MKTVFISYSKKDEPIVIQFETFSWDKNIKLIRDNRDLSYAESIKEFMKKIRTTDFCLMIISDNYLKSENCMFEVLEFIKDDNYKDRVLPILLKSAKEILHDAVHDKYTDYWNNENNNLGEALKKEEDPKIQERITRKRKKARNIHENIGDFLEFLVGIKMIVVDDDLTIDDYNKIYEAIFKDDWKDRPNFQKWSVWGDLTASPNGNTVTLNGELAVGGYVTDALDIFLKDKKVTLKIQNAAVSAFSDDRMIKITVNRNDRLVHPLNVDSLISGEYVPSSYDQIEFALPPDFDGKLGFVFYQANLKDLMITATYN